MNTCYNCGTDEKELSGSESAVVVLGVVTGPRPYYGKDVL